MSLNMQASIIGPTNIEKLSRVINRDLKDIENNSKIVGQTIAKLNLGLNVVFNY